MRKNIVAGNWKMNTVLEEGVELANQVNELLKEKKANCEVVICVPFTHLVSVKGVIDEPLKLGAENCSEHEKGAYTGEVSASMVKSTGASHVILGHSERRQYFGENNEQLLTKTQQALANGLTPIFCVGEVLEERENGSYNEVVKGQVEALFSLSAEDFAKIVIAYEPVWAIGTGKVATKKDITKMVEVIRKEIENQFSAKAAQNINVLYGGSVNISNYKNIISNEAINGALIGGASLNVDNFSVIARENY